MGEVHNNKSARDSLKGFVLHFVETWLHLWDFCHALVAKLTPDQTVSKTVTNGGIFAAFALGFATISGSSSPQVEMGVGKAFDYNNPAHHTIVAYYNDQVPRAQRFMESYTTNDWAIRYHSYIEAAAEHFDFDEAIYYGLMVVESGLNRKAVSPKGARGLMQVIASHHKDDAMPKAAELCGDEKYDPENPCHSIFAGAIILDDYCKKANGILADCFLFYNGGPNAKDFKNLRADRIADSYFLQRPYMDPKAEYRDFPLKVMAHALAYKSYKKFGKVLALQTREDYDKFFDEISLEEVLVSKSHKSLLNAIRRWFYV